VLKSGLDLSGSERDQEAPPGRFIWQDVGVLAT
jgi:hypothetical protein